MVFIGDRNNASLSISLGEKIGVNVVYPDITVFSDGEREVNIPTKFFGEHVVVLRCLSLGQNVDSFLIETALVLQCLNKLGAKKITTVIPYLPYSRSDVDTMNLFGVLFKEAGLSKLIVVDPHNDQLQKAFGSICATLSTQRLVVSLINELKLKKVTIVSPDAGGKKRVESIAKELKEPSIILSKKRRSDYEVEVEEVSQIPEKTCIILDDMITTGSTILASVQKLKEAGAKKIVVIATHGIFTNNAQKKLENLDDLIVSDSIENTKVKTFSIAELIASALSHGGE